MQYQLQPLRICPDWQVTYNTFYEVDPTPSTMSYFGGSSLLHLLSRHRNRLIDLEWVPEEDPEGSYRISVSNFVEVWNDQFDRMDLEYFAAEDWPVFQSKQRLEIVRELERTMQQIPVYKDPRILLRRGVVDGPAEQLRQTLNTEGYTSALAKEIVVSGNAVLQSQLIDHPEVEPLILQLLREKGGKKGVRKKADVKLNSRRYRDHWEGE